MTKAITIPVKDSTDVDQPKSDLSAEEQTFCALIAKDYTATAAYRIAFPQHKKHSYGYIRQLASDLLTKSNILTEVEVKRNRLARMARLAEDRLEDILVNDSSSVKGSRVADVAMFLYEQANGKAVQKVMNVGRHVVVTYNLGGSEAPPIPQEVMDQLDIQPAN